MECGFNPHNVRPRCLGVYDDVSVRRGNVRDSKEGSWLLCRREGCSHLIATKWNLVEWPLDNDGLLFVIVLSTVAPPLIATLSKGVGPT